MSRNVPWLSENTLTEVARQLFPTDNVPHDAAIASKEIAIATISTWRLRITDTIPEFLPIEATAELTAALLAHQRLRDLAKTVQSIDFAIRAAYSHAISRFVSTICDRYHPQNKGMDTLAAARFLGLPEYLVDLRHAIVHRKEPTFIELERAANDCLAWLKTRQWDAIIVNTDEAVTMVEPSVDRAQIATTIVDDYLIKRKAEIRSGVATESITQVSFDAAQRWLNATGSKSGNGSASSALPAFLQSLLEARKFWPKEVNDATMTSAFTIWNPLLMSIIGSPEPANVTLLLRSYINRLAGPTTIVAEHDQTAHGLYCWITWILTGQVSSDQSDTSLRTRSKAKSTSPWTPFITNKHLDLVDTECILHPGFWTDKLGRIVQEQLRAQGALTEADLLQHIEQPIVTPVEAVKMRESTDQIRTSVARGVEEADASLDKRQPQSSGRRGWKLQSGPMIPRPIGVSHTEALNMLVNG